MDFLQTVESAQMPNTMNQYKHKQFQDYNKFAELEVEQNIEEGN